MTHPEVVAGRSVLELGAGVGLVGIAAAAAGAASVVISDGDDKVLRELTQGNVDDNLSATERAPVHVHQHLWYDDVLAHAVSLTIDDRVRAAQPHRGTSDDEVTKRGPFDVVLGADVAGCPCTSCMCVNVWRVCSTKLLLAQPCFSHRC